MAYLRSLSMKLDRLKFEHIDWVHRFITPDHILPNLIRDFNTFDRRVLDRPANAGAFEMLFASYIREIWLGEFPPPATLDTGAIVDSLLTSDFDAVVLATDPIVCQKLQNLLSATRFLFGDNFLDYHNGVLDIDLVLAVHTRVGAGGVIPTAGALRTGMAGAVGSAVSYALPGQVRSRLEQLIGLINQRMNQYSTMEKGEERSKGEFLSAVLFFSEFLLIHPFANGNGRTARLLTNYILRHTTFVPFSLYYKSRDLYLQVLEDRSQERLNPPTALAFYMLLCAEKTREDLIESIEFE